MKVKEQEDIKIKRPKGSDKIKDRHKKNGKYNTKHIRINDANKQSKIKK